MTVKHEWEINYLVRSGLYADTDAVWRSALNALFVVHPDYKFKMLVAAYQAGDISLGKAAELMGVSAEEMKELLLRANIPIHLGPANAADLSEEVSAFERG